MLCQRMDHMVQKPNAGVYINCLAFRDLCCMALRIAIGVGFAVERWDGTAIEGERKGNFRFVGIPLEGRGAAFGGHNYSSVYYMYSLNIFVRGIEGSGVVKTFNGETTSS
jgi:hypothetical protein